jgi:hypothetical protein
MLAKVSQAAADARWQLYEQIAGVHRVVTEEGGAAASEDKPIAASTPEAGS